MNESRVLVVALRQPRQTVPLVAAGDGSAEAVIWPGMGARYRSLTYVELLADRSTVPLAHPGEAAYYVHRGTGTVTGADGDPLAVAEGTFVHLAPGTAYRFGARGEGMVLFGGPCPPDPSLYRAIDGARDVTDAASGAAGANGAPPGVNGGPPVANGHGTITLFSRDEPALMLPIVSRDARMIVWPGVGAWDATMNYVRMEPGEENKPHAHATSEDTIVILAGRGSVEDLTNRTTLEFEAGQVVHVPPKVVHAVKANRGEPVVSAGGPCPADLHFLRACGATIPDRPPVGAHAPG